MFMKHNMIQMTEIFSSIDLGTNTCILTVLEGDRSDPMSWKILTDQVTIVRLGKGVDINRKFLPEAMERTFNCLKEYSKIVTSFGVDPKDTIAVATSSSRDSSNAPEFFSKIQKETGFVFRVLSGDQEAKASFLGALLPGMDPLNCVVIDIGGGSTEFVSQAGGASLDIGSVRFTERFLKSDPVTDQEFWACEAEIDREIRTLSSWRTGLSQNMELVGVAGTVTTLASWHLGIEAFDRSRLDGLMLTTGDVHRMVEELKWRSIEERRGLTGIEGERADVLLAGAMILWRTMEILRLPCVKVATRGLRFGVFRLK
jgi:exopolyphosphatase/guanosine-5'-triphosphate,3'-diphosphate pyrophosphatase